MKDKSLLSLHLPIPIKTNHWLLVKILFKSYFLTHLDFHLEFLCIGHQHKCPWKRQVILLLDVVLIANNWSGKAWEKGLGVQLVKHPWLRNQWPFGSRMIEPSNWQVLDLTTFEQRKVTLDKQYRKISMLTQSMQVHLVTMGTLSKFEWVTDWLPHWLDEK